MILALVEHSEGTPAGPSLEALTLGRRLAEALGEPLHAVAVGSRAEATAIAAGAHGAAVLHAVDYDGSGDYAPRAWAHAVAQLMDAAQAGGAQAGGADAGGADAGGATPAVVAAAGQVSAVVAAATDRGSEVMAFVAAIADLPLAANCTDVAPGPDGQPWSVRRLRWAGSIQEVAELSGDGPKLLTVTPNAVSAEPADTRAAAGSPAPGSPAEVRAVAFHPDQADLAVRVSQRVEPTSDGVSLADARVVVGGGRGVGGEEGFAVLEELAGLLGGTVGVSRAVTSLGWRPHRDQVGQTGTRITPELYIACGISGAIQHMVGCKAARHILAINSDPDAPIMAKADYTVAGDLHAVLPAVVAEVRKARGEG